MAEAYEEEIIPEIDSTQIPISPVSSKEPTHRAVNKVRNENKVSLMLFN